MGRPAGVKNGQGKKAAAKKSSAKNGVGEKGAAQTAAAEPRAAPAMSAASNNGPTPEEKRSYLERYRNHRRALATIMEDAAEERGAGRSILKQFENKGGNPAMLKRMWELTDMTKGEAEAEIAEYLGYAVDIGIRVVFDSKGQGGFADVMEPTTDAKESAARASAYNLGYDRAKNAGQVSENPMPQGTEQHQQWHKGFSDRIWEQENPTTGTETAQQPEPEAPTPEETAEAAD